MDKYVKKEKAVKAVRTLPSVLYIGGYGRSGSTILDMLLGSHPDMVGVGELANVFDWWVRDESCSCLQVYRECPFWSQVMDRFQAGELAISFEEASEITRMVENGLRGRGIRSTVGEQYRKVWRSMMGAIGAVSKAAVVVDSSKSTRATAGRAVALAKRCQLDVKVIHLVRDPRAVVWSYLRGSNVALEVGRPVRPRGGAYRALFGWLAANVSVHVMEMTKGIPVLRIKYENLVADPVAELERIAQIFEIDLQPAITRWSAGHPLEPGHGVAGNRLRRQGIQRLQADDEWKDGLPAYARNVALLGWPLAREYGYRLGGSQT